MKDSESIKRIKEAYPDYVPFKEKSVQSKYKKFLSVAETVFWVVQAVVFGLIFVYLCLVLRAAITYYWEVCGGKIF